MYLTYEQMKNFTKDTKFRVYADPQRPFAYWIDLGMTVFDELETENMGKEKFLKFLKRKTIKGIKNMTQGVLPTVRKVR